MNSGSVTTNILTKIGICAILSIVIFQTFFMLQRFYHNLAPLLEKNRALILFGPRRVGKTTLLQNFLKTTPLKYKLDSGDNIATQQVLGSQDFPKIQEYISGYQLIAIDEAQNIPNIGMGLKIIIDQGSDTFLIATGSSSFDLSQQVGEPLTGRKKTITLYPVAQKELISQWNKHELREKLEDFLIFGSYPEVITAPDRAKKIEILTELVESYVLKDILALERVKSPKFLLDLLKLLAFQVGSEVSHSELATQLKIDVKTVDRYIDLLEKSFIIRRVGGLSRNLRKEITKKSKYYFLDTGIRNAVIAQFNGLENRNDVGQLFENFVVMEREKKCHYDAIVRSVYFWRTYDGQEIDMVEERGGGLFGYEVKWSETKKIQAPADWKKHYPQAQYQVINRENYLDFIA